MIRNLGWLMLALLLVGCQGFAFGPYVSPRVTGQVVDATTGQPVSGVKVVRGRPEPTPHAGYLPHGGELLIRKRPEVTDRDGRFTLQGERVLTPIHWSGWLAVRLTFERAGYQRFMTNFPSLAVTNSSDGTPLVEAGEIRMEPVRR